jgi:ketosteroid isomerase-like protein
MKEDGMISSQELQILDLLRTQAIAIRNKDAEGAIAPYAHDFMRCDLAPPLARRGAAALDRRNLESWFATWSGPIGYDLGDFTVMVEDTLAFCYGFVRISGTKVDGERPDIWTRHTVCLRRTTDDWKIVHEHSSVPFLMDGSYRAAVDLQP